MQIYIDMFKQFCLKYKRYFGVLILFIVFVVVLSKCAGPEDRQKNTEQNTQSQAGEPESQTEIPVLEGALEKNANEELNTLIMDYYSAYANADLEMLEMLASPITDDEKSYINTFSNYYEEYQNVDCYSYEEEGHYFVSTCYELKFVDIETPAPGMDFFYVERDGKGKLFINNVYSSYNFNFIETDFDATVYASILGYKQKTEVAELQQTVQAKYESAVASDEKLANFVGGTIRSLLAQWREAIRMQNQVATNTEPSENTEETTETEQNTEGQNTENDQNTGENQNTDDAGETGNEDEEPDEDNETPEEPAVTTFKVKALDNCNIRTESTTESAVLGQVRKNAKLTAVGTEGNWTKLDFNGETGYIRSDLVEIVEE